MAGEDARNLSLADIESLLERGGDKIAISLYPTKRWMDWADTSAGNARVMAVDVAAAGMTVSFSGGLLDQESIDYDEKMRFLIKKA